MRRFVVVSFVVIGVLAGSGCAPPAPSPALPSGVGVQWLRDTGGTVDPGDGRYSPAYDRYTEVGGVASGPAPGGSVPDVVPPFGMSFGSLLPDGTAMYPYNGFAGEGIVGTAVSGIVTMTFPGGDCRISLFDDDDVKVFPSPDGTKAAVHVLNVDGDSTRVLIVSLVPGGGECPHVVSDGYVTPFGAGSAAVAPVVWSPDSSAVVYGVSYSDGVDLHTRRIVRLDAATGAPASDVIPPTPDLLVPLGWSIAGRLLVETISATGPGELTLSTVPVAGGALRVLDRFGVAGLTTPLPQAVFSYVGYFAPGSTTVVFTGSTRVTNSTGQTYPWLRIRRIADAAGSVSAPLVNPKTPLSWHQEALDPIAGPPFALVDVPDGEVLERFVH